VPLTVTHEVVEQLDADEGYADAPALSIADGERIVPAMPWRLALKIGLGLLLLALVASFFWTPWRGLAPGQTEQLPAEAIQTIAPGDASALVTHPDFALLAVPDDEALAQDLDFLSWLAAGGQTDAPASPQTTPAPTPPATVGATTGGMP
jgi:hypothetical protein